MSETKKIAYFLPNIFTALNMACGFFSVIFSFRGEFYLAALIIILGSIFDSVDGRIARLTGTQSSFGEQFDSLSDAISFGVAPSILVFQKFFIDWGRLGFAVSFLFLLCGALRLARFNANIDKVTSDFFQGLPIPGGAWAIVGWVFLSLEFRALADLTILSAVYVTFYSLLMISSIPFPSFKHSEYVKTHKKRVFFLIMLVLISIFAYEKFMIAFWISIYVFGSLLYFLRHKRDLDQMFEWGSEANHD